MTLAEYLKSQRLSRPAFAEMVGTSVSAVTKWCRGERLPRPQLVTRIMEVTGGEVAPQDLHAALRVKNEEAA